MFSHFAKKLSIPLLILIVGISASAFARSSREKTAEKVRIQQEEAQRGSEQQGNGKKEENLEVGLRHSASVKLVAKVMGLKVGDDVPKEERDKNLDKAFWVSVVLNFLILLFILWFPLKKVLPTFFKDRTEAIQKRLEESRKSTEEARRRLAEVEGRLSRLDAEIAQMRTEADSSAQAEEQRVLAAVEEERRRIVQSAEQEIAMAANAARRELKAFAADLAVDLAEKKIQSRRPADDVLVHVFTTQLGKDGR